MWEQNVLFRSKMLKLFFSALPHICIRAREDTKNREYYNGWHIERTVERGNKITVFPSWLWILSSQFWTFLRSIDGRGGCWLSGKLWGAAPQRLGAHSEWVTPLLAGDHSTHWDPRQATIRTRWGRSYTSKPANAATRSEQRCKSFTGKLHCNCNYMIVRSAMQCSKEVVTSKA